MPHATPPYLVMFQPLFLQQPGLRKGRRNVVGEWKLEYFHLSFSLCLHHPFLIPGVRVVVGAIVEVSGWLEVGVFTSLLPEEIISVNLINEPALLIVCAKLDSPCSTQSDKMLGQPFILHRVPVEPEMASYKLVSCWFQLVKYSHEVK